MPGTEKPCRDEQDGVHFIKCPLWRKPPEMTTREWQEQSNQLARSSAPNETDALHEKETRKGTSAKLNGRNLSLNSMELCYVQRAQNGFQLGRLHSTSL